MSESFELPVQFAGKEQLFPAEFLPMGYTHKIRILVNHVELLFEPDEERRYRAVVAEADRDKISALNPQLIQAICAGLDEAFS